MDRKKVLAVSIILVVFVMVIGAYYGVIPTIQTTQSSAENAGTVNKAMLQGIPSSIDMTNTTDESYNLILTGIKGTTTTVTIQVMNVPANVSAYFTTTSTSHWKITQNGTLAEYKGYPLFAGDLINDLTLHIKATGNPHHGTIEYMAGSNDVLVIENGVETVVNTI